MPLHLMHLTCKLLNTRQREEKMVCFFQEKWQHFIAVRKKGLRNCWTGISPQRQTQEPLSWAENKQSQGNMLTFPLSLRSPHIKTHACTTGPDSFYLSRHQSWYFFRAANVAQLFMPYNGAILSLTCPDTDMRK